MLVAGVALGCLGAGCFAQRPGGNVFQFSVLGDRAAGDDDAFRGEHLGNGAVRERLCGVFGRDDFDNAPAYGSRADRFAV